MPPEAPRRMQRATPRSQVTMDGRHASPSDVMRRLDCQPPRYRAPVLLPMPPQRGSGASTEAPAVMAVRIQRCRLRSVLARRERSGRWNAGNHPMRDDCVRSGLIRRTAVCDGRLRSARAGSFVYSGSLNGCRSSTRSVQRLAICRCRQSSYASWPKARRVFWRFGLCGRAASRPSGNQPAK